MVGSSKNRTEGLAMSSNPILHRFRSPPDSPRVNVLPILVSAHPVSPRASTIFST